jgi:hypothetical protein
VSWIEQNENPQEICTQLGFCSSEEQRKPHIKQIAQASKASKSVKAQKPMLVMKPEIKPGDDMCTSCQAGISMMEDWLSDSTTEAQIETYLQIFCAVVPDLKSTVRKKHFLF